MVKKPRMHDDFAKKNQCGIFVSKRRAQFHNLLDNNSELSHVIFC